MPSDKPFNFAQALAELEAITAWFESDAADLDEGLKKFERGTELGAELKQYLKQVENRVEKIKLKYDDADSTAETAPSPSDVTLPEEPQLF